MRRAVLLLLLASCTRLDFLPLGEAELPYWDSVPKDTWDDGAHYARAHYDGTKFQLVTDLPWRCEGCPDLDRDGLHDEWETMILDRLRPIVAFHEEEPLFYDPSARVGAIGRVVPGGDGPAKIRVFIVLGYSFDYGRCAQGGHRGDTERVAMDLEVFDGTPPQTEYSEWPREGWTVDVSRFYTAAHEGTPTDASRISMPGQIYADSDLVTTRWLLFSARAKHGSFPSWEACQTAADGVCTTEDCQAFHHLLFPIVNAGEPEHPLSTTFFSNETVWSDAQFCGGLTGSAPCASSVKSKLVNDPFAL